MGRADGVRGAILPASAGKRPLPKGRHHQLRARHPAVARRQARARAAAGALLSPLWLRPAPRDLLAAGRALPVHQARLLRRKGPIRGGGRLPRLQPRLDGGPAGRRGGRQGGRPAAPDLDQQAQGRVQRDRDPHALAGRGGPRLGRGDAPVAGPAHPRRRVCAAGLRDAAHALQGAQVRPAPLDSPPLRRPAPHPPPRHRDPEGVDVEVRRQPEARQEPVRPLPLPGPERLLLQPRGPGRDARRARPAKGSLPNLDHKRLLVRQRGAVGAALLEGGCVG
mmetsp:Transcript_24908/g.79932  ORF Transcript_24908/g.79932 Transcript_24908/m.79932 type:complete len:279 (+) Transcript_24908:518-1354(+)